MAGAIQPALLSRKNKHAMVNSLFEGTTAAPTSESSFGRKMLEKLGWKEGEGLGKNKDGMKEHIRAKQRKEGLGLGASDREPSEWAPPPSKPAKNNSSDDSDSDIRRDEKEGGAAATAARSASCPACRTKSCLQNVAARAWACAHAPTRMESSNGWRRPIASCENPRVVVVLAVAVVVVAAAQQWWQQRRRWLGARRRRRGSARRRRRPRRRHRQRRARRRGCKRRRWRCPQYPRLASTAAASAKKKKKEKKKEKDGSGESEKEAKAKEEGGESSKEGEEGGEGGEEGGEGCASPISAVRAERRRVRRRGRASPLSRSVGARNLIVVYGRRTHLYAREPYSPSVDRYRNNKALRIISRLFLFISPPVLTRRRRRAAAAFCRPA